MSEEANIPLLDHELAEDELAWMQAVYADFSKLRASYAGREAGFNPKQALREVLEREEHRLAPRRTCRDLAPGGSVRIATAEGLPPSSCQGWSCISTREAGPTSLPCTLLARRMRFPSTNMRGPS